jgi:hypothetical protein
MDLSVKQDFHPYQHSYFFLKTELLSRKGTVSQKFLSGHPVRVFFNVR